jgi:hypothetical protein
METKTMNYLDAGRDPYIEDLIQGEQERQLYVYIGVLTALFLMLVAMVVALSRKR